MKQENSQLMQLRHQRDQVRVCQALVEGVVRPKRRCVQGVETVLTTTLKYVLQKTQFAENVERRGISSGRVGRRRSYP